MEEGTFQYDGRNKIMITTDDFLEKEYLRLHKGGKFEGLSLVPYVSIIACLIQEYRANSLLDYGCGKGYQYTKEKIHFQWGGLLPFLYDPYAIVKGEPKYRYKPDEMFDGVICSDVAEHIPPEMVDDFLSTLFSYPNKFVFLSICTRPAKKKKNLSDGRNCHLTIKPEDWWRDKIAPFVPENVHLELKFQN